MRLRFNLDKVSLTIVKVGQRKVAGSDMGQKSDVKNDERVIKNYIWGAFEGSAMVPK